MLPRPTRSLLASAVPLLVVLAATDRAGAQSASEQAAAEALFKQGRELMAAGKYAEACAKLAESERIDPAAGTALNLATCYERGGQLASAWVTYKDAARLAQRASQPERARLARQKVDELEPRLPTLTIVVGTGKDRSDLQVKRDGEGVGRAEWDTPIPVDPGGHTVEASAPGFQAWQTRVDVAGPGTKASVEVPALEPLPAPPPASTALPAPASTAAPVSSAAPPPATPPPPNGSGQRTIGVVVGGLGLGSAVLGAVFGAKARSDNNDAKTHCLIDSACDAAGISSTQDAQHAATYSTVLFAAGGVLLATGVVLYVTAPSSRSGAAASVGLGSVADGSGFGATLRRTW
jgi:hypothetical protein